MQKQKLTEILANNSYPGRGIVIGRTEDGEKAVVAYFIMGRSDNSRNRVFTETDIGVITEAADPAKMEDPSLIIYNALRKFGGRVIVTNGNQTDTIYDTLAAGGNFHAALRQRTFEPDAPNYTPRVSGMLQRSEQGFGYRLSIIKSAGGDPGSVQRFFYEYLKPLRGEGHFIHTYDGDGTPLPSFSGEPRPIEICGDIDTFGEGIWQALDEENKVALVVKTYDRAGNEDTRIYNKLEKVQEETHERAGAEIRHKPQPKARPHFCRAGRAAR